MGINEESNFNDLLKKNTAELEKLKLALEVHNYEKNLAFEQNKYAENIKRDKKRSRSEFLRLLLVLIVGSCITLMGNYLLDSNQAGVDILAAKQQVLEDHKAESIKKLHDLEGQLPGADTRKQKELFCLIGEIDNASEVEELATAITKYQERCQQATNSNAEREEQAIKAETLEGRIDKKVAAVYEENEDEIEGLEIKEDEGTINEQEKKDLRKAENDRKMLLALNPVLKKLVMTTEIIEDIQAAQIKETAPDKNDSFRDQKIIKTYVRWFKEGYFLQFGDIRVTLKSLYENDQMILVRVRNINSKDSCEDVLDIKKLIRYNKPLTFSSCSRDYMISLKKIGKAGKNPFNSAAYITMIELERE
ncbi:MAG: hypothetical protein JKY54_16480 [Flavobacteriales bacterium]|nr:hypothetical protein [Flavobacteriales bacterium]